MFEIIISAPWSSLILALAIAVLLWILYSSRKEFKNTVGYSVDGKKGSFAYKPAWWLKNWRSVAKVLGIVIIVLFFVITCTNAEASGFYLPPPFSWLLAILDWLTTCGGLCG
jgi:hypothetical protein